MYLDNRCGFFSLRSLDRDTHRDRLDNWCRRLRDQPMFTLERESVRRGLHGAGDPGSRQQWSVLFEVWHTRCCVVPARPPSVLSAALNERRWLSEWPAQVVFTGSRAAWPHRLRKVMAGGVINRGKALMPRIDLTTPWRRMRGTNFLSCTSLLILDRNRSFFSIYIKERIS